MAKAFWICFIRSMEATASVLQPRGFSARLESLVEESAAATATDGVHHAHPAVDAVRRPARRPAGTPTTLSARVRSASAYGRTPDYMYSASAIH